MDCQRESAEDAEANTYVLPVHPSLAVDLEIPGHGSLEKLLLLLVLDVQRLVLVRLPVRGGLNHRLDVRPAADERAGDDRVVRLAEDTDRAKEVLAGCLETVEEATDLIGRHERLGELLVVLEVDTPDREALRVEAGSDTYIST
jgi:hypothetical protein